MNWAGTVVASTALMLLPIGARAQARKRSAVPHEIVGQIIKDTAAYEMMPRTRDSLAANLAAEALDLDGAGAPELYVHGINSFCGAQNCPAWIYRRTSAGYDPLLATGDGVQTLEVRSAVSHGYRDVVTAAHESAWESYLTVYRFDGRRYRPLRCFTRRYDYLDAHGNHRVRMRPRITATSCK